MHLTGKKKDKIPFNPLCLLLLLFFLFLLLLLPVKSGSEVCVCACLCAWLARKEVGSLSVNPNKHFLSREDFSSSVAHHTESLSKCQICTKALNQSNLLFFFFFRLVSSCFVFLWLFICFLLCLKLGQCYILDNPLKNLIYQQLVRLDIYFWFCFCFLKETVGAVLR